MSSLTSSARFKAIVEQTLEILRSRGLEVLPVAVAGALEGTVRHVAAQAGMSATAALRYANAQALADQIAKLADDEGSHSIRPARTPGRIGALPLPLTGRLMMALAQATKYAGANGDSRIVGHATDLLSEFAAAIHSGGSDARAVAVDEGVFDETADLLKAVARHIKDDGWSVCPCGEEHGQQEADTHVPGALLVDAELARAAGSGSVGTPV